MAYNKNKLFKQAIELAEKHKCFFIEQLISFLPCDKSTFYKHFPIDSNENNTIKDILEKNRVSVKTAMYKKWFDSENASLQIALMKLICTDDEAHRLNGTRSEIKTDITTSKDIPLITWTLQNDSE